MKKSKFVKKCADGGPLESKYGQMGSTAGSLVGTALSAVGVPGLGGLFSMLGNAVGSKIGAPKDMQNQLNEMTVNKNPYGFAYGGPLPTGKLSKDEEAVFQEWRKSLPKNLQVDNKDYDLRAAWQGGLEPELVDGEWHLGSRNPETGQLLKSPNHPTYDKMITGEIQAGYTPSIDLISGKMKSFNYGGMLTGREDAAVYKGRLHSNGGILVNKKGVPSGKPDAEVEGEETVVNIGGKSYIFSNRLKI